MDKETYKVATKILERFDPMRLQGSGSARPAPGGSGNTGRPALGGLRPPGAASPMRPPPGDPTGMELRKRGGGPQQQLQQQQSQLNSSVSLPPSAALNTSQVKEIRYFCNLFTVCWQFFRQAYFSGCCVTVVKAFKNCKITAFLTV